MRRRLRHQRAVREALLLDLGALVFELHRHGRREPDLLQAKAAEVTAVDNEVRALSEALDEDLGVVELTAAGIAGTCPACGSLMSTDDRFCAACGRGATPGLDARPAAVADAIGPATAIEHADEPPEAPDEQMVAADLADEPEALAEPDEEVAAEPEPDIDQGEEPEPEPDPEPDPEQEPDPEPAPDPESKGSPAPWLQNETPDSPASPRPAPTPVRRSQSRLERALRGKRKG